MSSTTRTTLVRAEHPNLYHSSKYHADFIGSDNQLSVDFLVRIMVYVTLMVVILIMIMLIMKLMKDYDRQVDLRQVVVSSSSETNWLLPKVDTMSSNYGTCCEQDLVLTNYNSSSSEDLYDQNICIICYDNLRNCFFVPCGHCATCCACAERIVDDGENKNCPICRSLIHKVRKLFTP